MRRDTLARWVSILGHPFVTTLVLVGGSGAPPRTVALVALIVIVPVALLIVRQVRRGAWTNVDASNRQERPILYVVGILASLALLLVNPGSSLARGTLIVVMMLVVCALITRFWIKVSLHMAFCALTTTSLLLIHAPAGWVTLAILPLLAWSRLAMGRHDWSEVVLGTVIGIVFGGTLVFT